MADIAGEIRRLLEDSKKEQHQLPGMASLAYNHPGVLAYQIKSQPHYERDMRTASWLNKVAALREKYRNTDEGLQMDRLLPPTLQDAVKRRDELATPYWNRGALAYGQPLRNAIDWSSSLPATVFNAGRMVAGVPGADEDFADSADLAMLRAPGLIAGRESPMQVTWERERRDAESLPVGNYAFAFEPKTGARVIPTLDHVAMYDGDAARGLTSGDKQLGELGWPEGWPRRLAGAGLEAAFDPVSGVRSGIRALLRGRYLNAAGELGSEMLFPGAIIASQEAIKNQAEDRIRKANYR